MKELEKKMKTVNERMFYIRSNNFIFPTNQERKKISGLFSEILFIFKGDNFDKLRDYDLYFLTTFKILFMNINIETEGKSLGAQGLDLLLLRDLIENDVHFIDCMNEIFGKYWKIKNTLTDETKNLIIENNRIVEYIRIFATILYWKKNNKNMEQNIDAIREKEFKLDKSNLRLYFFFLIMISKNEYKALSSLKNEEKEKIKAFLSKEGKRLNHSPLIRIFEHIYIKKMNNFKNVDKLYHYTQWDVLQKIIQSGEVKLTKMDDLNDDDENKMLTVNNAKFLYSFSLTNKKDSLDLFGNYTNFEGLSIEFDVRKMFESFYSLTIKKSSKEYEDYTFKLTDQMHVIYTNDGKKYIKKQKNEIFRFLREFADERELSASHIEAIKYLNPFFKKSPWAYEEEFRVVIPIEKTINMKEAHILNGRFDESIYLKFEPKEVIKSVILGPKMKSKHKLTEVKKYLEKYNIKVTETEANKKH